MNGPFTVIWVDGEDQLSRVFYDIDDARAFANSQTASGYAHVGVYVDDF